MITIFTARPSARLILPIALLFLSLACGEDKTAGPEATGSLVIVAGFAEWATLEDQSAISQMVFTVSREGQTITTRPLQFEGRRWSAELELPVGRIDVRVEAFVGDVMTRHATVNVEVQRALSREVVVRLAWVVPERLQVRAPDGIYTAPPVVEISWQFSDNDHWRGFVVARREVGEGEFAALPLGASPDSVTISSRTYYDSTVVYPRAYEYRVAAMDTSGVLGDWSETIAVEISVQATELPPPPPPPSLVHSSVRNVALLSAFSNAVKMCSCS